MRIGLPNIALVGKAGAGKSTGADILKGIGYFPMSFAAPLKQIAGQLWGPEAQRDRELLQKLGVAVRDIRHDTWLELFDYRFVAASEVGPIVVDDCRFPNEWWRLHEWNFVMVRIESPTSFRIDRLKANGKWQDEQQLFHESETALDGPKFVPDYSISNDEGLPWFKEGLERVVQREARRR